MTAPILTSSRTRLRHWHDSDLTAFALLNADPRVMAYFPAALSRQQSNMQATKFQNQLQQHPFGLWAIEIPGITDFAGCLGLSEPTFKAHFTPCVEISWRLASDCWGHGYATEAARVVLDYALNTLGMGEIVSFTARQNQRSRAVMERLEMIHDSSEDFKHPALPNGHRLQEHVLYRLHK